MTEEQIKTIVEMYNEGAYFHDIAEAIDRSTSSVKRWVRYNMKAYGMKRRRDPSRTNGSLNTTWEIACSWNVKRGNELIRKAWGRVA